MTKTYIGTDPMDIPALDEQPHDSFDNTADVLAGLDPFAANEAESGLPEALGIVFGDEWNTLTGDEKGYIVDDILAYDIADLRGYHDNIGAGNLREYVSSLWAGANR